MASRVHMALAAPAVRASSGNGSSVSTNRVSGLVSFVLNVTDDDSGTTLDVDIEALDVTSGDWLVVASFTQVTTTTPIAERITVAGLPEQEIRAAWAIAGTSYEFSVSGNGVQI